MKERQYKGLWVFIIELLFTCMIPIVAIWGFIPTSVLNSNVILKVFELLAVNSLIIMFLLGIPVGSMGIIMSRKMTALKKTTIVLSIINILAGLVGVVLLLLIFYAVVFKGITH